MTYSLMTPFIWSSHQLHTPRVSQLLSGNSAFGVTLMAMMF